MKPVTLWWRFGDEGWEYNHLEDGHCANDSPTNKCEEHKRAWARGKWKKELAWLDANNIVRKENVGQ
jgi:hypothetical protein